MSEKLTTIDERFPGKLDQEQFDALKMEVSTVSPEEDSELRAEAESANTTFRQLYGKYCRSEPNSEELDQRVMMTDKSYMDRFEHAWFPEVPEFVSYSNSTLDMRAMVGKQGEFVLGTPIDLWPKLNPDNKAVGIERLGSEENAKKFVNGLVQYNALAHELSHLYQDPNLPLPFLECGAYYYGRTIAEHDRGSIQHTEIDSRADFYKDLLYIFGDDVHRLSFGTLEDTDKEERILNMFNPGVIHKLFPEMPEEEN